jgi:imidazolonepropionase-like amidohydrolase
MNKVIWQAFLPGLLLLAAPVRAEDYFIQAAHVYTMTGKRLTPGAVLVSNGKITQVGSNLKAPPGAKVIDLGQGVLMPGLVDAYCTAGIAGGPAEITREVTPDYRVLTAVDWRSRVLRASLAEGTTSLGMFPGTDGVVAGLACVVKTTGTRRVLQEEAGLVITMAQDPASGNTARQRPDSIYVRQPTNRMGVVWMLRSTFDKAARHKPPELAVVSEALAGQRRIYAVSRTENDLLSLLRMAKEFRFTPTIIGGHEAYKIRQELAAARTSVILGPITTSSSLTGAENSEVVWNLPGLLHKAGVSVALSGGHLLDQARFAVRNGLPEEVALEAITRTPARLLGIEGQVGSIQVGRDADLVALDGDPLELTTSIQWVLVDGKLCEKGK